MRGKGFTLVELITAMAMVGILLGVAARSWNSQLRKSAIERQTRTLYGDFISTRLEALYTKRPRSVVLTGAQFSVFSSCDTTVGPVLCRSLTYPLRWHPSGGTLTLTFDAGGRCTTGADTPICLDPANDLSVSNPGAVDCIVVSSARTKLGKRQGGACDAGSITQN